MNDLKDKLKLLIADGKTKKAIQLLLEQKDSFEEELEYQIITISNWYNRMLSKESNGIEVKQEEYQKIAKSILEVINQLDYQRQMDNNKKGEIIIFERNISVKLLPIPFLQRKIDSFSVESNKNKQGRKKLKLMIQSRNINVDFECPTNIKIRELKERILNHFQIETYTEYSSIVELKYLLTINNIPMTDEEKQLEEFELYEGYFMGIMTLVQFKQLNNFGGFGGGGGGVIVSHDYRQ